ncbi:MAG: hypothetical protein Q9195_004744 [Heterodermia aff. obscurata]
MGPAPLILLNGYPGVGKAAVASALQDLIPGSKFLENHLLIEPVAALLEREETGYRDLRKALRAPILDSISQHTALLQRTIITTYYQETLENSDISLHEYLASAKAGGRPFVVFILQCSPEENIKRLVGRSSTWKSKLSDVDILADIRQICSLYSFSEHGYGAPEVWEYRLDIEDIRPEDAAHRILEVLEEGPGAVGRLSYE